MRLTDLLSKERVLLADGAMGTYFAARTGRPSSGCESANLEQPGLIEAIHREYLAAGARLIRSNTFSANTCALGRPLAETLAVARAGFEITQRVCGAEAVPVADLGPIHNEDLARADEEYRSLIDVFLDCGAETFLFETLFDLEPVLPALSYLRKKASNAAVMVSFALSPDGRTRAGVPLRRLLAQVEQAALVDVVGLNCVCGPTHIYRHAVRLAEFAAERLGIPVSVMPNAGYPSMEQERTVFNTSPDYFARTTADLAGKGVSVLGGCCGTTPEHIRALARQLALPRAGRAPLVQEAEVTGAPKTASGGFSRRLDEGRFLIAAELDPPYGSDLDRLTSAARTLKEAGADLLTVSDSPLARAKLDSVICSAALRRATGMEVLPHICCRDKNVNALRASLLGAHAEGVRNVLIVTGDPVPEGDRAVVRPVFNLSSIRLMELVREMNEDVFAASPFAIGGVLNPGVTNPDAELKRLQRKMEAGASFFLTQPVFTPEDLELIDRARALGAKVLPGILPLVSYRNASYMSNEVPGIHIPADYVRRFDPAMEREEAARTGEEIACEIARMARPHADGFYFITPFNRGEVIAHIISHLRGEGVL